MGKTSKIKYHLLALVAVVIWGTTFVSTKTLILGGLEPTEIFIYRFVLAYLCIIAVSHGQLFAASAVDELMLIAAGLTGGSIYFIAENTALALTQANNVAILIAITPLLTTLLGLAVFRSERTRKPERIILGSLTALIGVVIIVSKGSVSLHFNMLGDILTLAAALSWAIYSLLVKRLARRYSDTFISRKVFGYGLLSMAVWIPFFHPTTFHLDRLLTPTVGLNLLYLGIVASMLCFTIWNTVVRQIGMVKASNYINLNPIVTFVSAWLFLGESVTATAIAGAVAVIVGVWLAESKN